MQALMGRIKRGAVGMPRRRKQAGINISEGVTSAVSVQETAEVPPVEPDVAGQPVAPTRGHWGPAALCSMEEAADKGSEGAGC